MSFSKNLNRERTDRPAYAGGDDLIEGFKAESRLGAEKKRPFVAKKPNQKEKPATK
jgi:hypothetical protein